MADFDNLLPGDTVDWVRKTRQGGELIRAKVLGKNLRSKLVTIRIENERGEIFERNTGPKNLRLVWGGKRKLEREAAKHAQPYVSAGIPTPMADPPWELLR